MLIQSDAHSIQCLSNPMVKCTTQSPSLTTDTNTGIAHHGSRPSLHLRHQRSWLEPCEEGLSCGGQFLRHSPPHALTHPLTHLLAQLANDSLSHVVITLLSQSDSQSVPKQSLNQPLSSPLSHITSQPSSQSVSQSLVHCPHTSIHVHTCPPLSSSSTLQLSYSYGFSIVRSGAK